MKITIFNRNKNSFGGQELHAQYLANGISKKHEVSFISIESEFKLLILSKKIKTFFLKNTLSIFDEVISLSFFSKKIRSFLEKQDLLIINNPLTFFSMEAFLSKRFGQKIITIFHSKGFSEGVLKKFIIDIKTFLYIQAASVYSDKFIFLTNNDKKYFLKKIIFSKSINCDIIPNGIDTNTFFSDNGIQKKSIIFVGKLKKSKGVLDIIKVAEKLPEYNFTFVGDGPLKNQVAKIKNCVVKSSLTQKQLAKEYKKNNIFVLPSYSESFPLSIIEAMASGLYIITSDIYGLKEIVLPQLLGNSVVKPGNVDDICFLIKKFYKDESLGKIISKNNSEYAKKNFSIKKMTNRYLESIKSI